MALKSRIFFLGFSFMFLFAAKAISQNSNEENFHVTEHSFDEAKWKDATEGLNYSNEKEQEINFKPRRYSFGFNSSIIQIILFIALIVVLVIAILYFLRGNSLLGDKKTNQALSADSEDPEKNLHEADIDRLLHEAIQSKNFRLALRYSYLKTIKELSIRNWINWKQDKTNREYLVEMGSRNEFITFRNVTFLYEQVWYGEKNIGEEEFIALSPAFRSFFENLKK